MHYASSKRFVSLIINQISIILSNENPEIGDSTREVMTEQKVRLYRLFKERGRFKECLFIAYI